MPFCLYWSLCQWRPRERRERREITDSNSAGIQDPACVEDCSMPTGQTIIATGSIQQAVDKAKDGDTIFLKDKIYYELFIPKSLDIKG